MDPLGGPDILPRLRAIFFAIFHPVEGPRVIFQVPDDIFVGTKYSAEPRSRRSLNLDFSAISEYIIPKGPLCGRLVTCYTRPQTGSSSSSSGSGSGSGSSGSKLPAPLKVLGYPTMIELADRYQRNHFIFNLCFVFDQHADTNAYEPIVRKCARVLRTLEEESSFLSRIDNLPRLYGIVEQLYEDLNSYYETFIAVPEEAAPHLDNPLPSMSLLDVEDLSDYITRASGPASREGRVRAKTSEADAPAEPPDDVDDDLADDERDSDNFPVRSLRRTSVMSRSSGDSLLGSSSAEFARHTYSKLGRTVRDAINIKLFPTYPNPPEVHDWDVPVLLVDLSSHVGGSWDLTLVRLIPYIDGVNHTKRIAQLAEADPELTRQCIRHLLYYSFAIIIDIFQFTNMYAVRPQIAYAADDIDGECAEYVTYPGYPLPTVPALLRMYSLLRQGRLVSDWIEEIGNDASGIDVRRLVTFGVIKGFLRRVHRYPVLVPADMDTTAAAEPEWPRGRKEAPLSAAVVERSTTTAAREATDAWNRVGGSSYPDEAGGSHDDRHVGSAAARRRQRASQTKGLLTRRTQAPAPPPVLSMDTCRVPPELPSMLDGKHCDDELCVRFGMSWSELHRILQWFGSPFAQADTTALVNEGRPVVLANTHVTTHWAPDRVDPFSTRAAPCRVKIIAI